MNQVMPFLLSNAASQVMQSLMCCMKAWLVSEHISLQDVSKKDGCDILVYSLNANSKIIRMIVDAAMTRMHIILWFFF